MKNKNHLNDKGLTLHVLSSVKLLLNTFILKSLPAAQNNIKGGIPLILVSGDKDKAVHETPLLNSTSCFNSVFS